jgi:chromate transport protein ChrA
MNPVRGIVMLLAAAFAFYRGWRIHNTHTAVLAFILGTLALAMAVWHFTRPADAHPAHLYRRRARQNDVTPR